MTNIEELTDAWAGKAILAKKCHSWKVSLGREIRLDPGDLDGSVYIEDILEEALSLYPAEHSSPIAWDTEELECGY
ncbi:hypothetical protein PM082_011462 [Marasmius tenuissimus]|nr:hypothetical protein PM082_011462 [Marasmius tenuissimus]